MTTEAGANVVAMQADILLETTAGGVLTVNDSVTVVDSTNRILAIAGGNLEIGVGGRFERGIGGSDGLVFTELNDLILENPGTLSTTFAQVDAITFNQKLQFIYATSGEQRFESTIFWGIAGPADDTFMLPSLNAGQLAALEALLFDGGNNFESRSFYDVNSFVLDGFSSFDGLADGVSDTVLSQPIGGPFDNSGTTNDTGTATASFRLSFLRDNPEFRNIQFLFNDANINIFENSSTILVDLNVATDDFEGLAPRIGETPVHVVERTEFQVPQRVDITVAPEIEFYQSVVVDEAPPFVQTVSEKFVVIVYFDSQFEADEFETKFDELRLEENAGETDYEIVEKRLLDALKLEVLKWDTADESEALDVNQIREILERAGLDLDDDETTKWFDAYQEWIDQRKSGDASDPPDLPRGVFKIIEVDNGKAVIQGDDIDRRLVPEPDASKDLPDYDFDKNLDSPTETDDNDTSMRTEDTISNRVARWSAMLETEASEVAESLNGDTSNTQSDLAAGAGYIGAGSTTVGLLAMLCHRNARINKTIQDEIQSLGELKEQSPERNIFSRAARFKRRNEHVNRNE